MPAPAPEQALHAPAEPRTGAEWADYYRRGWEAAGRPHCPGSEQVLREVVTEIGRAHV